MGSILLAAQGELTLACWLVFAGAFFDVLDGLAARALGGGTPLGAQLDSLADMVTFGVAPAFLVMVDPGTGLFASPAWSGALAALIIAGTSAWRLARFNVDTRQTSHFLGLATPANALFWASMMLASSGVGLHAGPFAREMMLLLSELLHAPLARPSMAIVLGILMLSELPLVGLKFKHLGIRGNEVALTLLGAGLLLVALYGTLAVPMLLLLYLLSPVWGRLFPKTT